MSTTEKIPADEPAKKVQHDDTHAEVKEAYQFTPKLSPAWALNLEQLAAVGLFGALYVLLNFIPLRSTDIWGHVMYGQWILDHGAFPSADPWMPLAKGMQVVDTAWLSQVIFGAVDRYLGEEALSHLFALVNIAAYVLFARLFYLQTRRVWLSVGCTGLLIFIGWSRFATIRPENFAVLCFALLLLLTMRLHGFAGQPLPGGAQARKFDYWTWIGIPLAMLLWANLHGSFVVGLIVLACMLIGRVVEVGWQSRDTDTVLQDSAARRWLYLFELSAAATLINPLGLDLWIHTVTFSSNPNLAQVLEWEPLVVFGVGGRPFAVSVVLLLIIWRQSRRAIRPTEVVLLLVFGFAAINGVRMLGWYAPIFVVVVAPHIADIIARWFPSLAACEENNTDAAPLFANLGVADNEEEYELPPGQSFRFSLAALLLIWIAFAVSPGSQIIFDKARDRPQLMSSDTPVSLTDYLDEAYGPEAKKPLPGGQTFHPLWWGDWLKHAGPDQLQAFVTTNIHLVPPQVWRDYQRVTNLQDGWENTLNRYNVTTVIVDRQKQRSFDRVLSHSDRWERNYEDEQAAIYVRKPAEQPPPPREENTPQDQPARNEPPGEAA